MAIEIFNRYEQKYLISDAQYQKLQRALSDYMQLDEYNQQDETYAISNIYYDTVDNNLIRTSLAKPKYKEKLRMRAYGVPKLDTKVFVENKKKVGGLVNKRRSTMKLYEAYWFLDGNGVQRQNYMNWQVVGELDYMLQHYTLQPALYLAYDRRAYFGVGQHDLRVSFDKNIRTRRTDLRLELGDYGEPLLDDGIWLMEIKVAQSIPVWLCKILSEYRIYPVSFSKYGAEYKKHVRATAPARVYIPAYEDLPEFWGSSLAI
jgi:hypothetical protein